MSGDGADGVVTVATAEAMSAVSAADWDRLATPDARTANPFVSHAFLTALERSKSVGPGTGWSPRHVLLRRGDTVIGAAPCYLKDDSYGEYIFDHGWAEAYNRAGGRYYPKLLCAVPFTPAPGPRLLAEDQAARLLLARGMAAVAMKDALSSVHINFIDDSAPLLNEGYLERRGLQFHWFNRGYECYEDFLGALASRKRKALRRERREAAQGLDFRRVTGGEIRERHWDYFWRFYQDTGARKWGRPYLTRAFFSMLGETMGDRILLVFAEDGGRPIAGALNVIGGDAIYGRYWGCTEDRPFLHFEVCYHQAIDFAIEHRLTRVEAGAQGGHKLARGYEPVLTKSAHWIADPGFRGAVSRFLNAEQRQVEAERAAIASDLPYRRTESGSH